MLHFHHFPHNFRQELFSRLSPFYNQPLMLSVRRWYSSAFQAPSRGRRHPTLYPRRTYPQYAAVGARLRNIWGRSLLMMMPPTCRSPLISSSFPLVVFLARRINSCRGLAARSRKVAFAQRRRSGARLFFRPYASTAGSLSCSVSVVFSAPYFHYRWV
jgi:hypothetical protein